MNERIKQLAEQAQKVVGYSDGGYTEIKQLDQELFAKLIVKECIKAYNDDGYQTEYEQDLKVLKHFGVEE